MSKRGLVLEAAASLYKEAGTGFVNALDDIWHKLVEEGWFGRAVTSSLEGGIHGPAAEPEAAEAENDAAFDQSVELSADVEAAELE